MDDGAEQIGRVEQIVLGNRLDSADQRFGVVGEILQQRRILIEYINGEHLSRLFVIHESDRRFLDLGNQAFHTRADVEKQYGGHGEIKCISVEFQISLDTGLSVVLGDDEIGRRQPGHSTSVLIPDLQQNSHRPGIRIDVDTEQLHGEELVTIIAATAVILRSTAAEIGGGNIGAPLHLQFVWKTDRVVVVTARVQQGSDDSCDGGRSPVTFNHVYFRVTV